MSVYYSVIIQLRAPTNSPTRQPTNQPTHYFSTHGCELRPAAGAIFGANRLLQFVLRRPRKLHRNLSPFLMRGTESSRVCAGKRKYDYSLIRDHTASLRTFIVSAKEWATNTWRPTKLALSVRGACGPSSRFGAKILRFSLYSL